MLTLFIKLILYRLYYWFGLPRILPISYTISVTDKCNSRCKTCNIHKRKTKDITLEEYESIFRSLGKSPYWVTISGGEPFLRKDLPEILSLLREICHPKIINIPTNGIQKLRIIEEVQKICNNLSDTQIIVNVSLDGVEELHNSIRNVPNNYRKTLDTYKALKKLNYPNLSVGIHTVISTFNVDKFPNIAQTLMGSEPDSYITEIAEERVEMNNFHQNITPAPLDYRAAIDYLIHRIKNGKYKGMTRITQAFRIEYYNLVKKILRDKKQKIPCFAGIASCQIAASGDVWFCCVKGKSVGKILKGKYHFKEIWFSRTANKLRKEIRKNKCFCPLANASYTNMLMNTPTLLRVFWRSYINWYK